MLNPMVDQALSQLRDEVMKAAEVKTTNTFDPAARSIFSPENLDEEIKYIVPVDTPLRNRFARSSGSGEAAVWKKMTSNVHSRTHASGYVGAAGTNTSIFFGDAGTPGETSQTYVASTAIYKLLGRKLDVGGLSLAASKGRAGQPDQQKSRERVKLYEVMLGEEEAIVAGDSGVNALEFDGLSVQITTNSGAMTFVTYSGVGTWSQQVYAYGADPTLLIANPVQIQALANDLSSATSTVQNIVQNGSSQQAGMVGGFALAKIINPVTQSLIDVKPSRFTGRGGYLLTEKSPAMEAWLMVEDLIPMSRVDVPSTTFSYTSFVLEAAALKVISEVYQLKFTCGA